MNGYESGAPQSIYYFHIEDDNEVMAYKQISMDLNSDEDYS